MPYKKINYFLFLQIRSTLEKIRNHMFKDEEGHNNANYKVDAEVINAWRFIICILSES